MKRGAPMRLQRLIILTAAMCASLPLLTLHEPRRGSFVWNFTSSIPLGLYRIEDRDWARGERVAVMPSGALADILEVSAVLKKGRVLLKRTAAAGGDWVCRDGVRITINGALAATALTDASLPYWSGCRLLGRGDVFLLGETKNSFDGRYFGVTSSADVVGPVSAIATF